MTPKEKAWKLFWEMKQMPDTWKDEKVMQNYYAKQCALFCIDEMINYHNSLFNKGFKDVHIALFSPIKTYNDILNPALSYLQEVKTEIEKL